MDFKRKTNYESNFFRMGIFLAIGMLLLASITYIFGGKWINFFPECYFHSLTRFYCPGCGGTRAILEMLQCHLWKSFYYHPFVLYGVIVYLVFMIQYLFKKNTIRMDIAMYIGIAIIILQWILKNVILLASDISWL